jgi:hypothetical protein
MDEKTALEGLRGLRQRWTLDAEPTPLADLVNGLRDLEQVSGHGIAGKEYLQQRATVRLVRQEVSGDRVVSVLEVSEAAAADGHWWKAV